MRNCDPETVMVLFSILPGDLTTRLTFIRDRPLFDGTAGADMPRSFLKANTRKNGTAPGGLLSPSVCDTTTAISTIHKRFSSIVAATGRTIDEQKLLRKQ